MLEHELRVATEAALRAGEEVARLRREGVRYGRKDGWELVSEADLHASEILHSALTGAFPSYGWLGEEHTDTAERLGRDRVWIVDPIDGTRAFIEGRDQWCVAVALIEAGRPVLAAVYRPTRDEFYLAATGEGASLNDAPIKASDSLSLAGATVAGNRKALGHLAPTGIVPDISGALPLQLRLAYVAAGRLDGAVSAGKRHDWDLAAGELLVIEAGGAVSGTSGEGYIYNRPEPWQQGLVAAGAKRHAALVNALRMP